MEAVGDLKTTVTYTQVVPGAYDPSADSISTTTTTHSNVPSVQARFTEDDPDWLVGNTKLLKLLIAYNDLPISVSDDDYVTISGTRWNVYKYKVVPGGSIHILFLREP